MDSMDGIGNPSKKLRNLIVKELKKVDPHLSVVDFDYGCNEYGFTDILAVDQKGQLALIDLIETDDTPSLVALLNKFRFVLDSRESIHNLFSNHVIDPALVPRILVIAPRFKHRFIRSLAFVDFTQIQLIGYKYEIDRGTKRLKLYRLPVESNFQENVSGNLDDLKKRLKEQFSDVDEDELETFMEFYE
ncbi:MAG: hypothetical protein RBU23_03665 [Candidatus Auribacterota bacterium]|nr:hypothetical protein [Candidatus Auribacterota bacterium]